MQTGKTKSLKPLADGTGHTDSVKIRDTGLLHEERLCEPSHGRHVFNLAVGGANVWPCRRPFRMLWRKNADNQANGHPGRESPRAEGI